MNNMVKFIFGFALCVIVVIFGVYVWIGITVVEAGPEGIGEFFGRIMEGFNSTKEVE